MRTRDCQPTGRCGQDDHGLRPPVPAWVSCALLSVRTQAERFRYTRWCKRTGARVSCLSVRIRQKGGAKKANTSYTE